MSTRKYLLLFVFLLLTGVHHLCLGDEKQRCSPTGGRQSNEHGGGGNDSGYGWTVNRVHASDPNEIEGNLGFDSLKWISINDQLRYTVRFENDPKIATAPAQNVFLHIPIHPSIKSNTLTLGSFGFGKYTFTIPPNSSIYSTRLDLRDSLGLYVDVIAGIDVTKNEVFWTFKSIDPLTGQAPTNAQKGFLPVNDTAINRFNDTLQKPGEGFVEFQLGLQRSLITRDTVAEQATIVFDQNESIPTNVWVNTIDAFAPTSHVNGYTVATDTIKIRWSGQDDQGGSGIRDYAIYVSENSDPFVLYQKQLTDTSLKYVGVLGNIYHFFSIATDNVGNKEKLKNAGEITVSLIGSGNPLPITWLYFDGELRGDDAYLSWATTSERDCKNYVLERSTDSRIWAEVGLVPALNTMQTNNYHYIDPGVTKLGVRRIFYRLRQEMLDNTHTYSKIVVLPLPYEDNKKPLEIKAYPNPFEGNITLQVINISKTDKDDRVTLYGVDGRVWYDKPLVLNGGATMLLEDLPPLRSGTYILKVVVEKQFFTLKMTRQ